MAVITQKFSLETQGKSQMIDITSHVQGIVSSANVSNGIVTVFVPGSTASVTTIEYEPGLIKDFPRALEKIAPSNASYDHDMTWGDGNGHSHVRASLMGPGIVVPFQDKRLMLGTWQQIVLLDFDVRPRNRQLVVQVMGE
ncbi:secondary thiamine-phosphate synthase enzyme [Methanocella sp. CWC-04]|uniref:Secondary thiamine-phosphate synthase enzyme n=1 Tax=Methanooceanicella nereidis TaxID=2052831 RepID=A0AAP2RCZ8_9EURY|nr:secondary thiamine-phosphate synthase enzyme YjbQ [Methanocella sp. CWC-04]MCD1295158.1 secondary thiamine-phosphate synthase enzyme [Methanocella sp. CWC-04]